jgi:hypothetical protein
LISRRLIASDSARRKRGSRLPPDGVLGVQVRVERQLRALGGIPETHVEGALPRGLAQEGVVVEGEAARLQVGLARVDLERDQLGVGDRHRHPVDIGKLQSVRVDAVEERVAHEHETLGRRARLQDPRLQRRQVRVVVAVHVVEAVVQLCPVAHPLGAHPLLESRPVRVFLVELPEVVRRPVDIERRRAGQRRQEIGIGPVPDEAHGMGVGEGHFRRTAIGQQDLRRARGRDLPVADDVLPPVAEILAGEGMPVRPAMAGAEAKGEDPLLDILDRGEDVGLELEARVVADQPRIAVDGHHAHVLRSAHDQPHLPAMAAGLEIAAGRMDQRRARQPLGDRRQAAGGDVRGQRRAVDLGRRGRAGEAGDGEPERRGMQPAHAALRGRIEAGSAP